MKQIHSIDRDQLQFNSLDMMVEPNSIVRLLDQFLDWVESNKISFKSSQQFTGRPAFPTRTLLEIYIYGYLHKIRSSRDLEKACKVNIELMWLVKGHRPCYKTIANFRKDNRAAFRNLFISYRDFCLNLELYGKQIVAVDGSKFRAQNSMKNNFNQKKIERHLEYIDNKQQEYIDDLDEQDKKANREDSDQHPRLQQLQERKLKYQELNNQLIESKETQISTTDPDARSLPLKMSIVEVAYNLQSAVDEKHKLIVDYKITNKSDHRALYSMAISAK